MTTKREIVNAALTEVGLAQYVFDISPERLQDALVRLNRMAAAWDGLNIRTGYSFGNDIDAESGIPDTLEECFASNLALRLAPSFGKAASVETKITARNALAAMLKAQRAVPTVPYPPNLPVGRGNRTARVYFPEVSDDDATDY